MTMRTDRSMRGGLLAAAMATTLIGVPAIASPPPVPTLESLWWDRTPPQRDARRGVVVRGDLSAARREELVEDLLRLERRLDEFLPRGREDPQDRVLWLFASRRAFEDTLRVRVGLRADGVAAVVLPARVGGGLAVCDASPAVAEVHEGMRRAAARRFVEARFGKAVPPALVEGLSAWAAASTMPGGEWFAGSLPPSVLEAVIGAIAEERTIGPERLLRLDAEAWRMNQSGPAAAQQAAEAWLLVSFLLAVPDLRDRFGTLLAATSAGRDRAVALDGAFGDLSPGTLDRRFGEWVRMQRPQPLAAAIEEAAALAAARLRVEAMGGTFDFPQTVEASPAATPVWRPLRLHGPDSTLPPGILECWSGPVTGTPWRLEVRWFRPQEGSLRHELRIGRRGEAAPRGRGDERRPKTSQRPAEPPRNDAAPPR